MVNHKKKFDSNYWKETRKKYQKVRDYLNNVDVYKKNNNLYYKIMGIRND